MQLSESLSKPVLLGLPEVTSLNGLGGTARERQDARIHLSEMQMIQCQLDQRDHRVKSTFLCNGKQDLFALMTVMIQ